MNKPGLYLILTVLAVFVLMTGAAISHATSYHSTQGGSITLFKADGITPASANDAYSPKASCARLCHPAETGRAGDFQHTYGTGDVDVTKNQKVIASDGSSYSETYTVKSFAHGVSVGRHMNQGRNETYVAANRTAWSDPFFTSSPGMWGKY
jgi:hypothetical protein